MMTPKGRFQTEGPLAFKGKRMGEREGGLLTGSSVFGKIKHAYRKTRSDQLEEHGWIKGKNVLGGT